MKGLSRDRKKIDTHYIRCSRCGTSGGTLVKIDDHYECQDKDKCSIMQFRKPIITKGGQSERGT